MSITTVTAPPPPGLLKYRLKSLFIDKFGSADRVRKAMHDFKELTGISIDRQSKHMNIRMSETSEIKESILISYAAFLETTPEAIRQPYTDYLLTIKNPLHK